MIKFLVLGLKKKAQRGSQAPPVRKEIITAAGEAEAKAEFEKLHPLYDVTVCDRVIDKQAEEKEKGKKDGQADAKPAKQSV